MMFDIGTAEQPLASRGSQDRDPAPIRPEANGRRAHAGEPSDLAGDQKIIVFHGPMFRPIPA
jgi:hypothetical protein